MDSKFSHDKNGDLVVNELCNMSDRVQMLYEMLLVISNIFFGKLSLRKLKL